jgi:hypothetical protein
MMTQHLEIANAYLDLWNENEDDRRIDLLNATWTETAHYSDPLMQGEGRPGIADMIKTAKAQFPGHRFVLIGTPDGHGLFIRFSWRLVSPQGRDVAGGTDVVTLDAMGRIENVVGFLDRAETSVATPG